MNQDRVKELLLEVEETGLEFSVIFTGKTSKKVNGLYKSDTHEILLHNKNFSNDNELLYTAIHEYTHHRLCEQDGGIHSSRVHTQRFWSYFHRLLQKAEEKGLYKMTLEESPELLALTETIRTTIMTEDGKLMKELGRLLGKARELCKQAGVRYEDYIDRVLCLPRASAATMEKMHVFNVKPEIGYEAMKIVANISNQDKRSAAEELFLHKKSPAFVRQSVKTQQPEEAPRLKLEKEKRRIERTIASLQERLHELEKTLAHIPSVLLVCGALLFVRTVSPLTAEENGTSFEVPAIPDIPAVTIDGTGLPLKPPRVQPPAFQHFNTKRFPQPQNQNTKDTASPQAGEKTSKPLEGLNAKTLSALLRSGGNVNILDSILGNAGGLQNSTGETVLTKILTELEKLRTKMESSGHALHTEGQSGQAGPDTGKKAVSAQEQDTGKDRRAALIAQGAAAELIRLRINGKEIKNELIFTFCSSPSPDGSFLYGADRRFAANGTVLNETIYMLCRKTRDNGYEVSLDLRQDPNNPRSFLYKLYELTPVMISKTSDLLFWHYKASELEIELVFRLGMLY